MYASVLGAFVLLRFVLLRVLLTNNRSCLSMCSSRAAFAHRSEDETSKLPRPRGYKPTAFRPAGWQGYESAGTDDDADDEFSSLLNAAGAPTPTTAATPAATTPDSGRRHSGHHHSGHYHSGCHRSGCRRSGRRSGRRRSGRRRSGCRRSGCHHSGCKR